MAPMTISQVLLMHWCLQFGHIGQGEIVTVIIFNKGFGEIDRRVASHGSDMKCSMTIQQVLKDYDGLCHEVTSHLHESLKVGVLKDHILRTEVPVDGEGHTRFPTIPNFDDASRSQLQQVYEDFMTVIWVQAGYTGPVDYDSIESNPSNFYDTTLLPDNLKLKSAATVGGWFLDLVEYLMANYSDKGRPFALKGPMLDHPVKETLTFPSNTAGPSVAPSIMPAPPVTSLKMPAPPTTPLNIPACPTLPSVDLAKMPVAPTTSTMPAPPTSGKLPKAQASSGISLKQAQRPSGFG
ncbi:hypothetical protein BT96DRAFT_941459 [Gymnopus androsaceus JB14]|uniref:Uncharacterized protein n=1 Tax=Gymnopus androsaceus JB14 TaxID=1447944 RepID=A0A6A4HGT2_9AGAR|nr:hypothetical protein BT96DRAFT_941459 [Gymnopus androsaceus JB14]